MSKAHWLALTTIAGIGGVTARKLIECFGDVEAVFEASPEELIEVPRVTEAMAAQILAAPIDQLENELLSLNDEGIDLLTWDDDRFPSRLRPLPDQTGVERFEAEIDRRNRFVERVERHGLAVTRGAHAHPAGGVVDGLGRRAEDNCSSLLQTFNLRFQILWIGVCANHHHHHFNSPILQASSRLYGRRQLARRIRVRAFAENDIHQDQAHFGVGGLLLEPAQSQIVVDHRMQSAHHENLVAEIDDGVGNALQWIRK